MKQTHFQKLLSLILALMVVLGTIPTSILPVSAANNADGSGGSNGSYSGKGTYNSEDCMWKVSVYVALKDTVNAETSGSGCALSNTNYWTRYGNPIFLMKGNNSTLKGRLSDSMFFGENKVDLMKKSTSASKISLDPKSYTNISSYILYDNNSVYVPTNKLNNIDEVKAYFANSNNFFYILRKIAAAYSGKSVESIDTVAELLAPIANKYVTIDGVKKKVYQSNGTSANAWYCSKGVTTKDYNGKSIAISPFSGNGGSSTAAVDWLIVYEPIFQVEPPNELAGKRYICATPTELAVLGETTLKDKLGGLGASFAYNTFPGAVYLQKSWLGYAKGTSLGEGVEVSADTILKKYGWGMRHTADSSKTSPASKYTLLDFSITASVDKLWNLLWELTLRFV